jgi:hypothetical protein
VAKQLKGDAVVDLAELEAVSAIWEAAKYGRKDRLLAYLRSNRPLTATDREYLADYLEGKLNRKKGRPRGGKAALNVRNVAVMVDFYRAKFREAGKHYRIHDIAVENALKYHVAHGHKVPKRETLENYLRRSKRRKK